MYHGLVRMVDDRASVRLSVVDGARSGIGSIMAWCAWSTIWRQVALTILIDAPQGRGPRGSVIDEMVIAFTQVETRTAFCI